MDKLDIIDGIQLDMTYAIRLIKQLEYNHMSIKVKNYDGLTCYEAYDYARQYASNSALLDLLREKVEHANDLMNKMVV